MNDQFQNAPEKRNNWILPVGIGCVVILCVCGAAAAGIFLVRDRLTSFLSDSGFEEIMPTEFFDLIEQTPATEGQYQDDFTLVDDFSSNTAGWIEYEDEITVLKFENGAYSFQVLEPTYYDWSYIPVDFSPTSITFDVYGLPGEQDGTFGVFCQYQDEYNYDYVEMDLQTREYVIAQIVDDVYTVLNEPLAEDYDWLTTTALNESPEDTNTITVQCTQDNISLIINDEWVNSVSVQDPFANPGEMAFFVYAYEFAGSEGYKVFFDNVVVQ